MLQRDSLKRRRRQRLAVPRLAVPSRVPPWLRNRSRPRTTVPTRRPTRVRPRRHWHAGGAWPPTRQCLRSQQTQWLQSPCPQTSAPRTSTAPRNSAARSFDPLRSSRGRRLDRAVTCLRFIGRVGEADRFEPLHAVVSLDESASRDG